MNDKPQPNGLNGEKGTNKKKIPKRDFFKKERIKRPANKKETTKRDKACRNCGSTNAISAHHIIFVSEGGDDRLSNLITLCFDCHRKAHDGYFIIDNRYNGIEIASKFISTKEFILNVLEKINDKLYEHTILEVKKKR